MKRKTKKQIFASYEKDENFKNDEIRIAALGGLEPSKPVKKKGHKGLWIGLGVTLGTPVVLVAAIAITIVATNRKSVYSFKKNNFDYSLDEKKQIASQSFLPLNDISYPSSDKTRTSVSGDYKSAVDSFAESLYGVTDIKNTNSCYSPLSLYAGLDILSSGASATASASLDSALGLSGTKRMSQWAEMYKANYYSNDKGTSQMHNGFFLTNEHGMEIDETFLAGLSSRFVEAYSLNFHNDENLGKMLSWVDDKAKSESFFDEKSLSIFPSSDTNNINVFYLFSTLYFQQKWESSFDGKQTHTDTFHNADGTTSVATFLKHTTFTKLYEYDKYVSCYDYYQNGESIEYFVPKSEDDSIFDLLDASSLFGEDTGKEKSTLVALSLPKFEYDVTTDFSSPLSRLGLSTLFDKDVDSFGPMLKSNPEDFNTYLGFAKQRNKVSFTETGTTIKTGTVFAGFGAGSADPGDGGWEVSLNQPFVYVIRDSNSLPLYVGAYSFAS